MTAEVSEDITIRLAKIRDLSQEIFQCMCGEVYKLGFASDEVTLKTPEEAVYRLERDPASCEYSLVGDWLDVRGFKFGTLLFHADGTFFVEQDIVRQHPQKEKWFVEAVNAWGRHEKIKVEARLIPMPE
ncbi:MAG: hypothetical protein K1563_15220 [Candidatus Thiodiazotropha sp. (ex. Lucinisca nassula)]|nr:hypothetical protein [Candidatus Thiodiazotropha sp. (ex. Lucinisca nassula)]MBW9275029.1 hypothetical protein [Candidatus Thiodiazotropha sp. (ex. Lucinisca nassula)]PUB85178.1 MAG: hypothetical protein DBP02_06065 [gamma proteobacterium symbiont of Ctena orbiculata]